MKILSSRSFNSPKHKLLGLVFAAPSPNCRTHLQPPPTTARRKSGTSYLTLFQLLSLCALICTILVYTTLGNNKSESEVDRVKKSHGSVQFRLGSGADVAEFVVIDLDAAEEAINDSEKTTSDNEMQPNYNNHKQPSAIASAIANVDNQSSVPEYSHSTEGTHPAPKEQLDNIFISVKSTRRFHTPRLGPILKTWFGLARNQTWFFTDDDDPQLAADSGGHLVNTHCPPTHYRQALCCKMSAEFDTFLQQTSKSWFCHFDDDNYVNVPALLQLLGRYDPRAFWYLGKPSLKSPIRIRNPGNRSEEISFWFATGGAGFCLSRALVLRMSPLASGGRFMRACDQIQLPDDVTMGYVAGHLLGQNLTVIPQFHSHFETMKFVDTRSLEGEITFSYVLHPLHSNNSNSNTLEIEGLPLEKDPTRFLSLHCRLFPRSFSYCSGRVAATKNGAVGSPTSSAAAVVEGDGEVGAVYYRK